MSAIAAEPDFPPSCVLAGMSDENGAVEAPRGSSVVAEGMGLLLVVRHQDLGRTLDFFLQRAD